MVMSVTTQTFFPYMSDANRPAVDVQMAAQDACVPLSFWLILSAILMMATDRNHLESFAELTLNSLFMMCGLAANRLAVRGLVPLAPTTLLRRSSRVDESVSRKLLILQRGHAP